jgi:hypothetical protein
MIINGVELDIDFTDADFIEKIENGSKEVYQKAEELKQLKQLSLAEGIRQECKILKDFLDYVLGDGTSEKLFKGKDSLKQCLQAFEDIINAKQTAMSDFQAKVGKYSPDRLKR